jgi:hypothetical protein
LAKFPIGLSCVRSYNLDAMACPFFVPRERADDILWLHPSRLPLGAGWRGVCSAPGHDGARPSDEEVKEHCNLGYARCSRLPAERESDSVRFSARADNGSVVVTYSCERDHRPVRAGNFVYQIAAADWSAAPEPSLAPLAKCYLQSFLQRNAKAVGKGSNGG